MSIARGKSAQLLYIFLHLFLAMGSQEPTRVPYGFPKVHLPVRYGPLQMPYGFGNNMLLLLYDQLFRAVRAMPTQCWTHMTLQNCRPSQLSATGYTAHLCVQKPSKNFMGQHSYRLIIQWFSRCLTLQSL